MSWNNRDYLRRGFAKVLGVQFTPGTFTPTTLDALIGQLARRIRSGCYQVYEMVSAPGSYKPLALVELQPVPEAQQPASVKGWGKQVFWAEKSDSKMPDKTDAQLPVARCPKANFNSDPGRPPVLR